LAGTTVLNNGTLKINPPWWTGQWVDNRRNGHREHIRFSVETPQISVSTLYKP
jgi:hypothetical protein